MKKIILGGLVFFLLMLNGNASNIFIRDDQGNRYSYVDQRVDGNLAFLLWDSDVNTYYSNLAYIANLENDLLFHATVQMLIWEDIHKDRDYYVTDWVDEIDTSKEVALIGEYLDEINEGASIANQVIKVFNNDNVTFKVNDDLRAFEVSNVNADIYLDEIRINESIANKEVLEFKAKDFTTINNYVYAASPRYENFEVTLEVQNLVEVEFIMPDNKEYDFKYGVYDSKGELIQEFNLNNSNKEIYYPKGGTYYLKDLSEDGIYMKSDDVILDDEVRRISIRKEYIEYNIEVKTLYKDSIKGDIKEASNDVTIYDENDVIVAKLSNETLVKLKPGVYTFLDNESGVRVIRNITGDMNISLVRSLINGIKTSQNITKICKDNKCFSYKKDNGILMFDEAIIADIYEVYYEGEVFSVDFSDYSKLQVMDGVGTILEMEKLESKKDVMVDVPDTGMDLVKDIYAIIKRKYYLGDITSSIVWYN